MGSWPFNCNMSWCGFLWAHFIWHSRASLTWMYFLPWVRGLFSYSFSQWVFCPFLSSALYRIASHGKCPRSPFICLHCLSCFVLLRLGRGLLPSLSASDLLLNLSSILIRTAITFFSSVISYIFSLLHFHGVQPFFPLWICLAFLLPLLSALTRLLTYLWPFKVCFVFLRFYLTFSHLYSSQ